MTDLHRRATIVLGATALVSILLLGGCNGVNAWVAGAENSAIADAASAANNVHTANVAAADGWARLACGLTLGGLLGAGNPTVTEAALKLCPPAGVSFTQISPPQGQPPLNPFQVPSAAKP